MSAAIWLMLISVAAVAALFIALAMFITLILRELRPIGTTPVSFLAKIRMGLRAIETETGHIPVQVTALNIGLGKIRDGLVAVEGHVDRLGAAVARQEESR